MSHQPTIHLSLSGEGSRRSVGAAILRAYLFAVDVDAPKRIDRYIDYFGWGGVRRSVVTPDRCGASLLDAGGAR